MLLDRLTYHNYITTFKKTKQIQLEIYPITVIFCLLDKKGSLTLEEGITARTIRHEDGNIFVYLTNRDTSILVHELFHVTEFIMDKIGQKFEQAPNETWAYLISYLTKKGLDFLK